MAKLVYPAASSAAISARAPSTSASDVFFTVMWSPWMTNGVSNSALFAAATIVRTKISGVIPV